jgi:hypothetical protein
MSRDGVTGLVALVASLVLIALTLDLKQNPMVPIGPGFYPRIVLAITAVLSLWLVVADLLAKKPPRERQELNYGLVALLFAVFGVYVGALPYLGFRVATFAYVGATNALLAPPRSA